MQIIVEVVDDGVVTPEIIRRRLLAEPREDVQLAGFQVRVVGEILPKFGALAPYMTGAKPVHSRGAVNWSEPLPYGSGAGLQMGKMDAAADRAAIDTLAGEESC